MLYSLVLPLLVGVTLLTLVPTQSPSVLVLLELTDTNSELTALGNLRYQFKIDHNIDGHMEHVDTKSKERYNFAVIKDGFNDDAEIEAFKDKLNKTPFVKSFEAFPFIPNPVRSAVANFVINSKEKLLKFFPFLSAHFPSSLVAGLTPNQGSSRKDLGPLKDRICSEKERAVKGSMVVINIMKIKKQAAADKYTNTCFNLFPSIGTQVFLVGKPRNEYWDMLALMEYSSRDNFCMMALSQEWGDASRNKVEGFQDTHTYMTTQVDTR